MVRLAIPRRVYTQSHLDYVSEVIIATYARRHEIHRLEIVEEARLLRHFTAKLRPATATLLPQPVTVPADTMEG